jgi:hypothetical protein
MHLKLPCVLGNVLNAIYPRGEHAMIDLAQRSAPYEISLPYGLTVTVEPLTTASMAVAQASARALLRRSSGRPGSAWKPG